MIVLSATDITKSYGTKEILTQCAFHVDQGDRVGVVGANGAGKTTLMDILAGELTPDTGSVFIPNDITLGYLRQKDDFENSRTVREEVTRIFSKFEDMEREQTRLSDRIARLAAEGKTDTEDYRQAMKRYGDIQERYERSGGFQYRSEMNGILTSMAFSEEYFDKVIAELSGGERTRLTLACLLMQKPDILILDEPTNHLDIGMLKWLEQFLKSYRGTVIMVSHDRYFLDQLCTKIFEVERHKLKVYNGNYTRYAEQKHNQREADLRAYKHQQEEIRRQEDMIRRFKERGTEHLAKRAASREKRLDQIERIEKPDAELGSMKIHFHQNYKSGNDVLFAEGLSKSFMENGRRRELFRGVDFDIKKGERICIVGPNGIGKTTLLRMMIGESEPTTGFLKVGHNVDFGYYDQRQEQLDDSKTVLDEVHDSFRLYKDAEIRGILGRFLFKQDQVFNQVGDLSGGEKARLALLKLMLSGANTLILDEPTNHLDIDSKEVFEEALMDYPGTVIAVSHDRYFLNRIATKIFELGPEGIVRFEGGYDYYEEKRADIDSGKKYIKEMGTNLAAASGAGRHTAEKLFLTPNGQMAEDAPASESAAGDGESKLSAAEERRLKKEKEAEDRRKKREIEKLEKNIEALEQEIENCQTEMCLPQNLSNSKKLRELDERSQAAQAELDAAYERWEELAE